MDERSEIFRSIYCTGEDIIENAKAWGDTIIHLKGFASGIDYKDEYIKEMAKKYYKIYLGIATQLEKRISFRF